MSRAKSNSEHEYAKAFGQMIRQERERLKLTQEQLSQKLKIKGNRGISRIENGERTPSVYHAAKIAEALNITITLNTHTQ
jgi:transcriptional regulator with XRE-family HTH domain